MGFSIDFNCAIIASKILMSVSAFVPCEVPSRYWSFNDHSSQLICLKVSRLFFTSFSNKAETFSRCKNCPIRLKSLITSILPFSWLPSENCRSYCWSFRKSTPPRSRIPSGNGPSCRLSISFMSPDAWSWGIGRDEQSFFISLHWPVHATSISHAGSI